MIEIDLSNLKHDKKGNVIWKECIDELVPFMYNNEIDFFRIVSYGRQHVTLEYNGRVRNFHIASIYSNHIEPLLDIYNWKFLYDVGDILGNYKILEQIFIETSVMESKNEFTKSLKKKTRGYKVECMKCGKQYEVKQKSIQRFKCKCQEE